MVPARRSFLVVQAPVAAWWTRFAGGYQQSYPVPPPSAAWAFVCNAMGLWTWEEQGVSTPMRKDAPEFQVAVGEIRRGRCSTILQHMHTYPVGQAGEHLREGCHGAKYFIEPATREVLTGSEFVIGMATDDKALHDRLADGLAGRLPGTLGALYAGSSDFFVSSVVLKGEPPSARWYERIVPGMPPRTGSHRFPVYVDRRDGARSTWMLLAPTGEPTDSVADEAWIRVPGRPS